MGEGLAVGLNPEPAEGLKLAVQGNRVLGGSPAIGIASREREAVCLLNAWKQTDGLTW